MPFVAALRSVYLGTDIQANSMELVLTDCIRRLGWLALILVGGGFWVLHFGRIARLGIARFQANFLSAGSGN
jgi:hypothetical protein